MLRTDEYQVRSSNWFHVHSENRDALIMERTVTLIPLGTPRLEIRFASLG